MTVFPESMSENPYYYFSPAFKDIIFRGMVEVIGRSDTNTVLKMSGTLFLGGKSLSPDEDIAISYHDLAQIQVTLQELYGLQGGQGLAWKMGRACFTIGLRTYGKKLGLMDLDYRLLPLSHKLKVGLQRIAQLLNQSGVSTFRLKEDAQKYYWIVEKCPLCWHHHTNNPSCQFQSGTLQEYFYWASGGKNYNLRETECIANGAQACVFAINKIPLE